MQGGLWVSAAGMMSRAAEISVWANDVANSDTPGFRALLPSQVDAAPGTAYPAFNTPAAGGTPLAAKAPAQVLQGGGAAPGPTLLDTTEGPLTQTGGPLDVAILGHGFLTVRLPGGGLAYTRGGAFGLNAAGTLVAAGGLPLLDANGRSIRIPRGATDAAFTAAGAIVATAGGRTVQLARLRVVVPADPQGMAPLSGGLWRATPAAGPMTAAAPGAGPAGRLLPGALEGSNVDLAAVMADVLAAQQAYAANTRALGVALNMWSTANHILG